MNTDPSSAPSAEAAVQKLAATKAEHRQILSVIAADAGMSPATRTTLVAHLLEEEDEQMTQIAALTGGAASAPAATPALSGNPFAKNLTVGSLRPEPAGLDPLRLGSLRVSR